MAFGLWRYARGRAALPKLPVPNPLSPARRVRVQLAAVAVIAVVGALFGARVIHPGNFSSVVLGINIVAVLGYFGRMLLGPSFSASEKRHVLAYVPLFLAACVFWVLWFPGFPRGGGPQLLYDNKEGARRALSPVTLEEAAGKVLADHR